MGEYKLTIDPKSKIARGECIGKFESKELGATFEEIIKEFRRYQRES